MSLTCGDRRNTKVALQMVKLPSIASRELGPPQIDGESRVIKSNFMCCLEIQSWDKTTKWTNDRPSTNCYQKFCYSKTLWQSQSSLSRLKFWSYHKSTVGNQALRAGKNSNQLHHKDFENGHMLTFKIAILLSHGDD